MKKVSKFYFSFFLSLLSFSYVFSSTNDSIEIRGHFMMNKQFVKGVMYQFNLEKKITSTFDIKEGVFLFKLPLSIEPGVYRLEYEGGIDKQHTDIIIDGKEPLINFELKYMIGYCFPDFKSSVENKKWYDYLRSTHSRIDRLTSLFNYLAQFSNQYSGNRILKIYQKERRIYYRLFSNFLKDNTNTWACLLVANKPYYFSDLGKKPILRDFIRLNYYWEGVDTSNPSLINTPVYGEHIESYLNKIITSTQTDNPTAKENKFKVAIDIVIDKFSNTSITRRFAIEYLLNYFNKSVGTDKMIDYVKSFNIE